MDEIYKREIVQRITKNMLDVQILRLVKTQPMWGYKMKKQAESRFGVRLRHGALYPTLNSLEKNGFLTSQKQGQGKRIRKVYSLAIKGEKYLDAYNAVLREQLENHDLE